MQQEKYGFVYIWYDRKHNRFYIGCRWGKENDGYICSSVWMKAAYKRRPQDFKRRILSRIYSSRFDLLEEEFRFLSRIRDDEIGKKYYNLTNHRNGHWTTDPDKMKTIGEKISATNKGRDAWWAKGKSPSVEARKKMSEAKLGKPSPRKGQTWTEETRKKSMHRVVSEDARKKMSEAKLGKPREYKFTETHKVALSTRQIGEKNHNFGKSMSEETKRKISETARLKREARLNISRDIDA